MKTSHDLETLLQEYMYRKTLRLEDDITQLSNNVTYRAADPVDHLEMIMAQARLASAEDIFADIRVLIAISRSG